MMATATPIPQQPMAQAKLQPRLHKTTTPKPQVSLRDAIRGGTNLPTRLTIIGQPGIGKTMMAAQSPDPLFLLSPAETGLHTLIDNGLLPPIPNIEYFDFANLVNLVNELTETEHAYKTLVFDTIDGAATVGSEYECTHSYQGDWSSKGFDNYSAGHRTMASGIWKELFMALDRMRSTKKMGIIFLVHAGITTFQNPRGLDYNRYTANMSKYPWKQVYEWSDIVLFADREATVDKDRADQKAKPKTAPRRILITEYDMIVDAKNRHNLPPEIDMGESAQEAWANFTAALAAGRNSNHRECTQ